MASRFCCSFLDSSFPKLASNFQTFNAVPIPHTGLVLTRSLQIYYGNARSEFNWDVIEFKIGAYFTTTRHGVIRSICNASFCKQGEPLEEVGNYGTRIRGLNPFRETIGVVVGVFGKILMKWSQIYTIIALILIFFYRVFR